MKRLSILTLLAFLLAFCSIHRTQAQDIEHPKKQQAAPTNKLIVPQINQKPDAFDLQLSKATIDRSLFLIVSGYWIDEYFQLIDAAGREFGYYGIDQPSTRKFR